jgi:hypothetical protein
MSRTNHREKDAERGVGKKYWKSRLHRHGEEPGACTKKLTHKKERRAARRECAVALRELLEAEDE